MSIGKKIFLFVGLFLLITATFFTIKILKEKNTLNESKDTLRFVTEQIFTCPNKDIIKLYNEMINTALDESQSTSKLGIVEYDTTKLDKKLYETYSNYISNKWYEAFRTEYYTKLFAYSIASEYDIKVRSIDIVQSKKVPTNYSFTLYLTYGLIEGDKKDTKVEGSAQLTNERKISYITFFDKDLYQEIRNSLITEFRK